ncbi:MAG: flagellar biosynthesis protein FlhA [Planctomycetes bacterium]|nr:flagellar biosynthesis protein FlhA [Planctomycetota bacterium]
MTTKAAPVAGSGQLDGRARQGALAVALMVALAVMLVPLPPALMDLLLAVNLSLSLLIVLTVLNTARPMDFSTFPSVLLFAAVFRLALNVATTRLILGNQGDAGSIIRTFGDFVVGGNHVVGIVVFLILVVIQFVVITRGQNRISEVAARFTLDALPGKQMAIDADLNAGVLTNEEATKRRRELSLEAQFYGAMDGAGKFVRGDAIAALIITAINLIGGVVIGVFDRGLGAGDAFRAYSLLTIGDGLVSQVPALMVSTAAGILTSKGASESELGPELTGQLLDRPAALRTVGGLVAALALLPGMPTFAFLGLGLGAFAYAARIAAHQRDTARAADAAREREAAQRAPDADLEDLLAVDRLSIEIGYRLVPLVDGGRHGGLLDQIRALRAQLAATLGIVVPPIRVRDNVRLDAHTYRILLNGCEVARGEVRTGQFLAMDPGGAAADNGAPPLRGTATVEPAFGLPATWIPEDERARAEGLGFTVIDAPSVLVTHLAEVLRRIAPELLTRDDVKALLDNLERSAPAVVKELIPNRLTLGQVQQVLARLLTERVSIRNLQVILETLADRAGDNADARALTEHVRAALARSICEPHLDDAGTLFAAVIDPDLEKALADAVAGRAGLDQLPAGFLGRFVDGTAQALAELVRDGRDPVLVTRAALRPFLAEAIAGVVPNASVLSYQETRAARRVETTCRVSAPA